MKIDRTKFFALARRRMFNGNLTQRQVDGMEAILDAGERHGMDEEPPEYMGTLLGTAYGEVGAGMYPVREGFATSDMEARQHVARLFARGRISRNYALPNVMGLSFYGRGFVQLTHEPNYKVLGDWLALPLLMFPDKALELAIAADILVVGCVYGLFTDRQLSDYLPGDLRGVRRVVNGTDRADEFARLNEVFTGIVRDSVSQMHGNALERWNPITYLKRMWKRILNFFNGRN